MGASGIEDRDGHVVIAATIETRVNLIDGLLRGTCAAHDRIVEHLADQAAVIVEKRLAGKIDDGDVSQMRIVCHDLFDLLLHAGQRIERQTEIEQLADDAVEALADTEAARQQRLGVVLAEIDQRDDGRDQQRHEQDADRDEQDFPVEAHGAWSLLSGQYFPRTTGAPRPAQ